MPKKGFLPLYPIQGHFLSFFLGGKDHATGIDVPMWHLSSLPFPPDQPRMKFASERSGKEEGGTGEKNKEEKVWTDRTKMGTKNKKKTRTMCNIVTPRLLLCGAKKQLIYLF